MSQEPIRDSSASSVSTLTSPPPAARRGKPLLLAVVAAGVLAGAVGAYTWYRQDDSQAEDVGPTGEVRRGPLFVSITESGVIKAKRRSVISNDLRWPVIIKKLVPEGTRVQVGETIIEFECKELADAIAQQEITVTSGRNAYTQAHENLVLKEKELAHKTTKAKQAVKDAEIDLERYTNKGGEREVKEAELRMQVILAKEDLKLAEDRLSFKIETNKDAELNQPYSKNEIEAERLAIKGLQFKLTKAENALNIFLTYDDDRQERLLRTAVEDAKLDKIRTELEQKTQLMIAKATEEAKKATLDMQQKKLDEMLDDQGKLVKKAEKEGLVVYDTGGHHWRGRSEDIAVEVGAKISPRQQLMIIPDMTSLQVETKVYESMIDDVHTGLEAHVRLDAKKDVIYKGKIDQVGAIASSNRFLSYIKFYTIVIKFDADQDLSALKPNMTANVEMIVGRLDNALSVPVAAVFTHRDEKFCWRVTDAGQEKVPVQTGLMNDKRVQIVEDPQAEEPRLRQGDRVLLVPMDTGKPSGEKAEAPPEPPNGKPSGKAPSGDKPSPKPPGRPPGGQGRSRPGGAAGSPRRAKPPGGGGR